MSHEPLPRTPSTTPRLSHPTKTTVRICQRPNTYTSSSGFKTECCIDRTDVKFFTFVVYDCFSRKSYMGSCNLRQTLIVFFSKRERRALRRDHDKITQSAQSYPMASKSSLKATHQYLSRLQKSVSFTDTKAISTHGVLVDGSEHVVSYGGTGRYNIDGAGTAATGHIGSRMCRGTTTLYPLPNHSLIISSGNN